MACFILEQCVPGLMPGFWVGRRRDGETGTLNPAKGLLICTWSIKKLEGGWTEVLLRGFLPAEFPFRIGICGALPCFWPELSWWPHSVFCPRAAGLQFSASPLECFPESPWANSCVPAEAVVLRPKLAGSFALVTGFCGKAAWRRRQLIQADGCLLATGKENAVQS